MAAEVAVLELNHTWTIQELPHGKQPIGCRSAYKLKYKIDGGVEKY